MRIIAIVLDLVVAGYITREVASFSGRYRRLKLEVSAGNTTARTSLYRRALVFEWLSALLALTAMRVGGRTLSPVPLALQQVPLVRRLSAAGSFHSGLLAGVLTGIAIGTIGFIVMRLRRRRSEITPAALSPPWRLPDFAAALPVTARERGLWLAVSISAGVCEEIVFRGWLLSALHGPAGLAGLGLVVAAAAIFGLAHFYQGAAGMLLTTFAGVVFCVLYVATGSLLVPILVHCAVDARFALLPAPRALQAHAA